MTTHKVRDGSRYVQFDGTQLAAVSSERPNAPRWTELELFRTDSGKYVLSKVGRSKVLHMPGCPRVFQRLSHFVEEFPQGEPERDGFTYDDCVPTEYILDDLLVEQTRYWAFVADEPGAIIESLHNDKDGARYLPRMSVTLLTDASRYDSDLADAFYVQRVL